MTTGDLVKALEHLDQTIEIDVVRRNKYGHAKFYIEVEATDDHVSLMLKRRTWHPDLTSTEKIDLLHTQVDEILKKWTNPDDSDNLWYTTHMLTELHEMLNKVGQIE